MAFDLPAKFREDLGYTVKDVSDKAHKELSAAEVLDISSVHMSISRPGSDVRMPFCAGRWNLNGDHDHEIW